jgi:hypothetical protein
MKLFIGLLSTPVMKSNHVGALRPCINGWLGQGRGEDGGQTAQSRQSAKLFSSLRNWDPPNPSPGGAQSLAREGVGES